MKVIDLLNKIANGEETPEYIRYYDRVNDIHSIMRVCVGNLIYELDQTSIELNDEVRIIEEVEIIEEDKKIEKICKDDDHFKNDKTLYRPTKNIAVLTNKINEIIEVLNERDIQRH